MIPDQEIIPLACEIPKPPLHLHEQAANAWVIDEFMQERQPKILNEPGELSICPLFEAWRIVRSGQFFVLLGIRCDLSPEFFRGPISQILNYVGLANSQ